jgi:catechol-2,3-dioxygenase
MPRIMGFFEVGLRVSLLIRSEIFYCDALGLSPATRDDELGFLAVRGGQAVLRLQEDRGSWPAQRVAFAVDPAQLEETLAHLRRVGHPVEGPFFHEWLPAMSFQLRDPDGHLLELCTTLDASA